MTFRRYMVIAFICVSGAFGDFCLKLGMSKVPPITLDHLGATVSAIAQPLVLLGIFLLIGFFSAYLTALSWADLTYVLPATAVGYIVIALLSRFILHEEISAYRWFGILLITAGVGFVTQGPAKTTPHGNSLPEVAAVTEAPAEGGTA